MLVEIIITIVTIYKIFFAKIYLKYLVQFENKAYGFATNNLSIHVSQGNIPLVGLNRFIKHAKYLLLPYPF